MSETTHTPLSILKSRFGYDSFRQQQKDSIDAVLAGKDVFVLMPTGGGKSLCYQIPALLLPGVTVVVSPLIALMKDQVDALRVNGIEAEFLNSSLSPAEQSAVVARLRRGELKLLYVAPEKLTGNDGAFLRLLKSSTVSLFAIDEAHCVSQWGHDFRPDYFGLSRLKQEFPMTPIIALTATADDITRKDILMRLGLLHATRFVSSFDRANIHYRVVPKLKSYERLLDFLQPRRDEAGIIYTLSKASAETLAERLSHDGFPARPYHAGLPQATKTKHQEMFQKDEIRIIVATIAFGMGINKSNVRFVAHMDMPKNIESYYQETGRAGRDGLRSDAILFYSGGDVMKLKNFAQVEGNPAQSRIMLKKLWQMADFCKANTCRRKMLLAYFGERAPETCDNCDICTPTTDTFDHTVTRSSTRASGAAILDDNYEHILFDTLRALRRSCAEKAGVPPYVVFSDATLRELATYLPLTLADMSRISGFGEVKIARYGALFLAPIVAYCSERGLTTRIGEKSGSRPIRPSTPVSKLASTNDTAAETLRLFQSGTKVDEIARLRALSISTIENHLASCIAAGTLAVEAVVDPNKIPPIKAAVETHGIAFLKPLKVALGDSYSYGEIRAVLASIQREH